MVQTIPLLKDIDAFLAESGMAAATFGHKTARDGKLVARLRAGGDVSTRMQARIRAFMADYRARTCQQPASDVRPAA